MVPFRLRIGILLALAAPAPWTFAQDARNIRIDPAGENTRAYLSYMDATAEALFAGLLDIPRFQDYRPFAMLLTNTSGQAIVLITVRWSGISGNKTIAHDCSSDSLGVFGGSGSGGGTISDPTMEHTGSHTAADGPVVLSPGERMIVAPGLMAREDLIRQGRNPGGSWGSSMSKLQSAAGLSVSLDTVVLQDGSVYGQDASQTINGLLAHKAAIDFVARYVRAAEQKGMDGMEALRLLGTPQTGRRTTPAEQQQFRIARMLMGSRTWKQQLEKMEALRLPSFHRR